MHACPQHAQVLLHCCCCLCAEVVTHHAVNLVCCDTGRDSSVCGIKRLTTNPAAAAAQGTQAQATWAQASPQRVCDPVHCSTRAVLANTVQLSVCMQRGGGRLERLSPAGFPDACYLFWAAYGHAALLPAVHLARWVASASIVRPRYVLRHLHTDTEAGGAQGQPTPSFDPALLCCCHKLAAAVLRHSCMLPCPGCGVSPLPSLQLAPVGSSSPGAGALWVLAAAARSSQSRAVLHCAPDPAWCSTATPPPLMPPCAPTCAPARPAAQQARQQPRHTDAVRGGAAGWVAAACAAGKQ